MPSTCASPWRRFPSCGSRTPRATRFGTCARSAGGVSGRISPCLLLPVGSHRANPVENPVDATGVWVPGWTYARDHRTDLAAGESSAPAPVVARRAMARSLVRVGPFPGSCRRHRGFTTHADPRTRPAGRLLPATPAARAGHPARRGLGVRCVHRGGRQPSSRAPGVAPRRCVTNTTAASHCRRHAAPALRGRNLEPAGY